MTDAAGEPKPISDAVAKLRERIEINDERKRLTPAQRQLLDHSATIFGEPATKKDAAFMPRELVQVTLPHKNPGDVPQWVRSNGNLTIGIQPGQNFATGKSYGYPYGTIPRLLLFWISTEAKRNGNRRLELGQSLSAFMEKLGLDPQRGGKRSDARRLRDQMERLFRARISFQATLERADATGEARLDMQVVNESELWWSRKDPNQTAFWGSWVELGEKFFAAITAYPVPADIRALRALKRSPLALDLYSWLTYEAYRAHRQGKPRFENWEQLHAHLGAEYGRLDNFRMKAKAALRKIMTVYPGLRLGDRQGGIQVLPGSGTAIQSCNTTIDGVCKTL